MAGDEAVAAAGRTVQALLSDRLTHPNGSDAPVPVTLGAPGPERSSGDAAESVRVNLFLYQVAENPCLANQEIPGSGHPGAYGHPPLSLNLHFLLTVFGSTVNGEFLDETPAHWLLGSAMRVLHDHGIVTESLVSRREPSGVPLLDPLLHGEHERVKLTLWSLGLEDLSNVWTALALPYRLSVAYEVSVVQIESGRPRRYPRPVQEPPGGGPRVHTTTLRRPQLASVTVRRAGDPADFERATPFARVGDTLVLRGSGLAGQGLKVRVGTLTLAPETASGAGDRLEVIVPDAVAPDGSTIPVDDRLQPGAHSVAVVATVAALPGAAVGSGQAAFTLVPGVTSATVTGRVLTVAGNRLVAGDLPAQVIVGGAVVERRDYLAGSDADEIALGLPDTLPAWPAAALISGDLADFPDVPSSFDLSVTVGADGPATATLSDIPTSLPEAATLLQAAIRGAATTRAFTATWVAATDRELVVVPGGLTAPVEIAPGALANALALSPSKGATARAVYLSGDLRPFPALTSASPELDVTIGATTARVGLGAAPVSLPAAASALEAAVQAVADPGFAGTRVAVLGDQLCLVPPDGDDVAVAAAAGSDEHTIAELHLAAPYPVRVRVGGVEAVDEHAVVVPA